MPPPRDPQAFPGLAAAAAAPTHSPKMRPKAAKAPAPTRAREADSVPSSPTPRKAAPIVLDDVRRHDTVEPPYLFSTFDWLLSTPWGDGDFSFYLPSLPTSMAPTDDHDAAPYSGTFNPFDEPDSVWGPYEQPRVPDAAWPLRQQAALHRGVAPHMLDNVRAPEEQRSAAAAMLAARARQLQEAGETVSTHSMSDVRTHLARQQAQQQAQHGPTADAHSLLTLLRRGQEPDVPADAAAATPPAPLPPPGLRTQPPNRATGLLLAQLLGTPPAPQHPDAYAAGVPPTTVRQP